MSDPAFTPGEKAALDHFTVPSLRAGFADRVAAATAGRPTPEPTPKLWKRRGGRSGWRRRASIVGSGIALGLLSAAAAATGYFGEQARIVIRDTPVIGPIIAQVSPAPKPVRVAAKPRPKPAEARTDATGAPVGEAAPRTLRPETLADRLERRAERRKALGLPPVPVRRQIRRALREMPPEQRRELVQRIRDMPPEERMALRQRFREMRRERMAERRRFREERREPWVEPPAPTEPLANPVPPEN